jgi:hypothetical protein
VTLEFVNLTLDEIAERLRAQAKIHVAIHESLQALLDARQLGLATAVASPLAPTALEPGGQTTLPMGFSCRLTRLPLATALRIFLEHYGLGYAVLGDTLVLAAADTADRLQREQPVRARIDSQPLTQAVEDLNRRYGAAITLDAKHSKDVKITVSLRDVSLAEAVRLVAQSADLGAAALAQGWLITSPVKAAGWDKLAQQRAAAAQKATSPTPMPVPGGALVSSPLGGGLGDTAPQPIEVPPALLQVAGPPPRADRAADAAQNKAVAVPLQRAAEPKPSAASEVFKKLREPMDFFVADPIKLGDLLVEWERHGMPRIVIDRQAFKNEDPDAPEILDTEIKYPQIRGLPRAVALRQVLSQVPTNNATYLVRPGYITVTTADATLANKQFVQASFFNAPLDEALHELAEQSGIGVLLDPRVGAKAKTPVTARFAAETNLAQAVRLLADMADLKAVRVDSVMYVTSRNNAVQFPPEAHGTGKYSPAEIAGP